MELFNRMYMGFMKDLPTNLGSLIILGYTSVYLFTHEPYVPMERELTTQENRVVLKIREVNQEIHNDFQRLEIKLSNVDGGEVQYPKNYLF